LFELKLCLVRFSLLSDPAEALLDTKFEHHIDAASLSLIMPMLKRSLMDRNTDTKSRATKIVANICHLADHKGALCLFICFFFVRLLFCIDLFGLYVCLVFLSLFFSLSGFFCLTDREI
jgi:hypothetical protein